MKRKEIFYNHITEGYKTKGDFLIVGSAMLDGETVKDAYVKGSFKNVEQAWTYCWCHGNR